MSGSGSSSSETRRTVGLIGFSLVVGYGLSVLLPFALCSLYKFKLNYSTAMFAQRRHEFTLLLLICGTLSPLIGFIPSSILNLIFISRLEFHKLDQSNIFIHNMRRASALLMFLVTVLQISRIWLLKYDIKYQEIHRHCKMVLHMGPQGPGDRAR
jgi:hypothetical protein